MPGLHVYVTGWRDAEMSVEEQFRNGALAGQEGMHDNGNYRAWQRLRRIAQIDRIVFHSSRSVIYCPASSIVTGAHLAASLMARQEPSKTQTEFLPPTRY